MKKRRLLSVILSTALMAVMLTACGDASGTTEPTDSEAVVSASADSESADSESAEEAASENDASEDTASDGEYNNSYCENGEPSALLTKLRESGTLLVGSSGDSYAYIDQNTGEFEGIDAVIIKEVAKRLGIANVEMKLINFSELIVNLNEGNIDMITDGMYTREDRAEQIYFGDIWYTQGGVLVVPEDSKIDGQDTFDPDSTVVGYTEGTAWQTRVEQWQKDGLIKEARGTGDQSSSLTALQYGKIDAFLTDSTVMEDMIVRTPEAFDGLRFAANYTDTEAELGHIAPSVSFENIAFMKEVNNVIAELREEGFIDEAFKACGLDPALHAVKEGEEHCEFNTREE